MPTNDWNTPGKTASTKNACEMYGLTEVDLITADPPIECKWRSSFGNSYAVVRLSDVAALSKRLAAKAEEDRKKTIIAKHGKAYYNKMIAAEEAEEAEEEAARNREATIKKLLKKAKIAIDLAAAHGLADSIEGVSIAKTSAKKDWFVSELDDLTPVDSSKKQKKYHLSDVIGKCLKDSKRHYGKDGYDRSTNMPSRIANKPDSIRLYARYLLDLLAEEADKQPKDIRTRVRKDIKATMDERISQKQAELASAKATAGVLDSILGPSSGSKKSMDLTSPSSKTAKGALVTPAKTKATPKSRSSTTTRNTRNSRNTRSTRNSRKRISNEEDDYEEEDDHDDDPENTDDDYTEPTTASRKRKRTVRA